MMIGREHEADAGLLDAARDLLRCQIDHRTERFEYIGATGFARHAAVAMLGNPASGCCRNEHRCSRNIERVRAVTTRADRSEEHTSELQSLMRISYAAYCLKTHKHLRH